MMLHLKPSVNSKLLTPQHMRGMSHINCQIKNVIKLVIDIKTNKQHKEIRCKFKTYRSKILYKQYTYKSLCTQREKSLSH